MAFLTLNGIEVPVSPAGAIRRAVHMGGLSRGYNGSVRSSIRTTKMELACTTNLLTMSEALAYEGLVRGLGHVWNFDVTSSASSAGLLHSATSGFITIGVSAGKYGNGMHLATAAYLEWTVGYTGDATVLLWLKESGTFRHYELLYTGGALTNVYREGVAAANPGVVTLTSGALRVTGVGGGTTEVDELVCVPYTMPLSWASAAHTLGVAYGQLPKHVLGGTWLSGFATSGMTDWVQTAPVDANGTIMASVTFNLRTE